METIPVSTFRTANLDWLGTLTFGASMANRFAIDVVGARSRTAWGIPETREGRTTLDYIIQRLLDVHFSTRPWTEVHLEATRNVVVEIVDENGQTHQDVRQETLYEKTIPRVATAGEHSLEDVLRRLQGIKQGLSLQVHVKEHEGILYTVPTSDWVHLAALFNREFRVPTKAERTGLVTGVVSL